MASLTHLVFSLCCFQQFISFGEQGGLLVQLDSFKGVCPGLENVPMKMKNISIAHGFSRIPYSVEILQDLGRDLLLKVHLWKCHSKETPDTCSTFANINTKQVCRMIDSNSDFYSPFITCLKPRFKCPLVKGLYHGDNCTFDTDSFSMFPVGGYYWKIKVEILHGSTQKIFFCASAAGTVRRKY